MTRQAAIQLAQHQFDDGSFKNCLKKRIAQPTESQNPARAPELLAYLSQDLPAPLKDLGVVPDLREAMAALLTHRGPLQGTAVIYDLDQTEGTYAAAEYLRDRFDRVVVLSPRETIAEEVVLVMRQRIHRRFAERGIEVKTWVDPVWTERFENEACLQYRSVFGGPLQDIDNVAFFAYATPRRPHDELHQGLLAAGLSVSLVGDCKIARDTLSATAEGHEAGMNV